MKIFLQHALLYAAMALEQEQKVVMMPTDSILLDANKTAPLQCQATHVLVSHLMFVLKPVEIQPLHLQNNAMTQTQVRTMDAILLVKKNLAGIVVLELVRRYVEMV